MSILLLFATLLLQVSAKGAVSSKMLIKKIKNAAESKDFLSVIVQNGYSKEEVAKYAKMYHVACLNAEGNPHKDDEYRARNAFKVSCPTIGTLYKKGLLIPDEKGRVTNFQITNALHDSLDFSYGFSAFQGIGIAAFEETDINQFRRDRAFTSTRYLNIFRMHHNDYPRSDTVQHGYSTTIHDTRYDPEETNNYGKRNWKHPEYYLEDVAQSYTDAVRASREKRMKERYFPMIDWEEKNGEKRMYIEGLAKLMAEVKTHGDYSGEWAYKVVNGTVDEDMTTNLQIHPIQNKVTFEGHPAPLAMTEWQPLNAWASFFCMLGRVDAEKKKKIDPKGEDPIAGLYMTEKDLLDSFLDYEFNAFNEKDWKPLRNVGVSDSLAATLPFNDIIHEKSGFELFDCAGNKKCVFPWVEALKARDVVKEGSWWTIPEERTLVAAQSLLTELGLKADGDN